MGVGQPPASWLREMVAFGGPTQHNYYAEQTQLVG